MPDVFISYASEDRLKANTLARLFSELGCEVWWDQNLTGGEEWSPTIMDRLRASKCVVVLWSRDSVGKEWVQKEAIEADHLGTLVPVLLQPASLDTPTPDTQAVKLSVWNGGWTAELRPLIQAVEGKLGIGVFSSKSLIQDEEALMGRANELSRFEVVQVVLDYCALSLKQETLRRAGYQFSETEFREKGDAYDRLKVCLSSTDGRVDEEQLHELLGRFLNVLIPEEVVSISAAQTNED